MAFDVSVGMFLCADDEGWADERLLAGVNRTLRRLRMAEHREPRTLAELDPPLAPGTDPCLLGVRLGFYGSGKYERLADFARYLAVHGTVPLTGPGYDARTEQRYDGIADRRTAFDHVIATVGGLGTVVLPRGFDEVIADFDRPVEHGLLVSAQRLRVESVTLAYALRYTESRVHDWVSDSVLDDGSPAQLDGRIADDPDVRQAWAEEADLCHRLLTVATDVLRSGALGISS